jgi:multiple sugar transport system permease protein
MASLAREIPRGGTRFTLRPRNAVGVARHAFLILVAVAVAYPFYFMVTSAFKDILEATRTPPNIVPSTWHPENFAEAWDRAPWGRYFFNTILVSAAVTVGEVATSVLAAYAFSRMRFRGKNVVFTIFLATLMIPGEATLIPNFVLMSRRYLNLYDTYWVQIIPFLATAFSIFLLRQFFLSIPNELSDAARLDGAGHLRFLWSIVLPLSIPALITVGLITFLGSWNAFQWPLIVTNRPEIRPIQVGLAAFRQEAGSSYHLLMAASTFVIAPIVVLYLVAQRYLVQGIARTGIRG